MVSEETIVKKMKQRGFTESARGMNGDSVNTITFIIENTRKAPVFCTVTLANEHFQFNYVVPRSMNQLQSPDCGSVMNDNHFDMIYSKFEEQAAALHKLL